MIPATLLDTLILLAGAGGALALLGGCLLVGLCIWCDWRHPPPDCVPRPPANDDPVPGWRARLLAIILGGGLMCLLGLWWLGLTLSSARRTPEVLFPAGADTAPWRANLFPWE